MPEESLAGILAGRPPMDRELPGFDVGAAPERPGELFVEWLLGAMDAGVPDAQVVTLSTVDADGVPDARMLVLRDVDAEAGGWVFACEADSPKGRQLAAHPVAAMTVYWPQLGRQVRVRGDVSAAPAGLSGTDFRTRSPGARIAALVGRQSEPLSSWAAYQAALEEVRARLAADPELLAPSYTVYSLRAREVEFWQGDRTRRHVRLCYTRSGSESWSRTLLWP